LADKVKNRKPGPVRSYFRETTGELRKVSWPSRREALQLTGLVIAVMLIVGIILASTDRFAIYLLSLLLG